MFVFALFNLQGTVLKLAAFAVSLLILSHQKSFVKNLFRSFSNFFFFCVLALGVARALRYIITPYLFCQALFSTFFKIFGGSYEPPNYGNRPIKEYHQSGHIRHHYAYKPQQKYRHCLHRGMRRNYAPAGSSASQLLHAS